MSYHIEIIRYVSVLLLKIAEYKVCTGMSKLVQRKAFTLLQHIVLKKDQYTIIVVFQNSSL